MAAKNLDTVISSEKISWSDAIDGFLASFRMRTSNEPPQKSDAASKNTVATRTLKAYRGDLVTVSKAAEVLPSRPTPTSISSDEIKQIFAGFNVTVEASTRRRRLTALNLLLLWLVRENHRKSPIKITRSDFLLDDERSPVIPDLDTLTQMRERFLQWEPTSRVKIRNRVAALLVAFYGLTVAELCALSLEDIERHDRQILLNVRGKRSRRVWLSESVSTSMATLIRPRHEPSGDKMPLFISKTSERLPHRTLVRCFESTAKLNGLDPIICSPRQIRIAILYQLNVVQKRPNADLATIFGSFSFPWKNPPVSKNGIVGAAAWKSAKKIEESATTTSPTKQPTPSSASPTISNPNTNSGRPRTLLHQAETSATT